MVEVWKSMNHLNLSKYKCSNLGRIKIEKSDRVLRTPVNNLGYMRTSLVTDKNETKSFSVHRLVYQSFNDTSISSNIMIDHIDRNRVNNNINNLREVSVTENNNNRNRPEGQTSKGRRIVQLSMDNEYIQTCNISEGIVSLNYPRRNRTVGQGISNACKKSNGNMDKGEIDCYKEYKGFRWVFEEDYYGNLPYEIWKPLQIDQIIVQLSNKGRVKMPSGNITYGYEETQYANPETGNYKCVMIAQKTYKVHILVMKAFVPMPDIYKNNSERIVVDHINELKSDNRLENLRWSTNTENLEYKFAVSVIKIEYDEYTEKETIIDQYPSYKKAGIANGYSGKKISEWCAKNIPDPKGFYWKYVDSNHENPKRSGRRVNVYDKNKTLIDTYESLIEAGHATNISHRTVQQLCKNKIKNPENYLYSFEYA